jgi:hypothetical protein
MANYSVLVAGVALLGSTACDGSGVDGNGERSEELRELSSFTRIRSDCELDLEVVQGDEAAAWVSVDSNLQRLVTTRVVDDTLYVDTRDELDDIVDGPHVLITLPSLTAAKLAGSGSLAVWLDAPEGAVDLYLTGSGSMRFQGQTSAVGAFLSGSGYMRLEGETSDARLGLSGSGAIYAEDLSVERAQIALSGSGDVSANVSESVQIALSGSGDIELYGAASIDGYDNTGSGDLVRH